MRSGTSVSAWIPLPEAIARPDQTVGWQLLRPEMCEQPVVSTLCLCSTPCNCTDSACISILHLHPRLRIFPEALLSMAQGTITSYHCLAKAGAIFPELQTLHMLGLRFIFPKWKREAAKVHLRKFRLLPALRMRLASGLEIKGDLMLSSSL